MTITRSDRWGPWLAALAFITAFMILVGGISFTLYQQQQNRELIEQNAKTAHAMCDAAVAERDFWINVQKSIDPLNFEFRQVLNDIIIATDELSHFCDDLQTGE